MANLVKFTTEDMAKVLGRQPTEQEVRNVHKILSNSSDLVDLMTDIFLAAEEARNE